MDEWTVYRIDGEPLDAWRRLRPRLTCPTNSCPRGPAVMSRFFRPNIARMAGYVPGEQPQGGGFIKLNTNENPYPPSPRVKAAIVEAVSDRLRLYPDPMATAFRTVAARLHGVEPDMVLAGNGSDDLLTIITRAFVGPGRPGGLSVAELPALFDPDRTSGRPAGGRALRPRLDARPRLALDVAGLKLVYLANPDSPSGTAMARDQVAELAATLDCPLIVDEAYGDFADPRFHSMPLVADHPNVIVTRSFSKGYSLAGLRLGYLVARAEIVADLIKVKDSYNCDMLSQVAGIAALEDQDYLARDPGPILATRGAADRRAPRRWATRFPRARRISSGRPAARPPARRFRASRNGKILVRLMCYPGYPDGLRITVGTDAEIDRLLEKLKNLTARST